MNLDVALPIVTALAASLVWLALYVLTARRFARRALLQAKERLMTDRSLILTGALVILAHEVYDAYENSPATPFLFGWSIAATVSGVLLLVRLFRGD